MLLTVSLLVLLYVFVILRAAQFFMMTGPVRDDDKTIGAVIIAASVMFIFARITTFVNHPSEVEADSTAIALWVGFGLFNAMLYLGLLHRMTVSRSDACQPTHLQQVEAVKKDKYRTAA